jgi:adenylate cyclase
VANYARHEYEYEIPGSEAAKILNTLANSMLVKRRWYIPHAGHVWHVDQFGSTNTGLVIAEIELSAEQEIWLQPDWCGEEVSHDMRYSNYNLSVNPYQHW